MRARYTAHVLKKYDFLVESAHPEFRDDVSPSEIEEWSSVMDWKSLEILGTKEGLENDETGEVSFCAHYSVRDFPQELREDAFFRKGFCDIFKGVTGERVWHKVHAGSQEHEEAVIVLSAQLKCGTDSVDAFHIDIHEHKVKAAAAKRLKKIPCAAEGDCLHRVSGASAETAAELSHPVQVFLFIIH